MNPAVVKAVEETAPEAASYVRTHNKPKELYTILLAELVKASRAKPDALELAATLP